MVVADHADEVKNVATVLLDISVAHVPICRWIMGRVWFETSLFCHGLDNPSNSLDHSVFMSFQHMPIFILTSSAM